MKHIPILLLATLFVVTTVCNFQLRRELDTAHASIEKLIKADAILKKSDDDLQRVVDESNKAMNEAHKEIARERDVAKRQNEQITKIQSDLGAWFRTNNVMEKLDWLELMTGKPVDLNSPTNICPLCHRYL